MSFIKKILKIEPQLTDDGAFYPSPFALKLATSATTNFDGGKYSQPYNGTKLRILMICTEEHNMTMANNKKFSTGNHPVEMALPMLHLLKAGFEIDVATATGKPAAIEMWAMPEEDENVLQLFTEFQDKLNKPQSLEEIARNSLNDASPYIGIFIPGGHGAMLGLPENDNLGELLRWANKKDIYVITLCHGPGTLISAKQNEEFIYEGYETVVFPDKVDKQTPMVGYLPGHMPWEVEKTITELGMKVMNKKADDSCHIDRKLITGASPKASNALGRLAATTLLADERTQ